MISHVAFLRAINTGRRRVTNARLVGVVEAMGFDHVEAFQASGNVLFGDRSGQNRGALERELCSGLNDALGFDVPVIVRTADEVHSIARATVIDGAAPTSKPQVILMAEPPDGADVARFATEQDQLAVVGADVLWCPREGVSTSSLDLQAMEKEFTCMTVRTLGTIRRISDRLPGGEP